MIELLFLAQIVTVQASSLPPSSAVTDPLSEPPSIQAPPGLTADAKALMEWAACAENIERRSIEAGHTSAQFAQVYRHACEAEKQQLRKELIKVVVESGLDVVTANSQWEKFIQESIEREMGTSIYRSPKRLDRDSLRRVGWRRRCGRQGFSDYRSI